MQTISSVILAVLLWAIFPAITASQTLIRGFVLNQETDEPIPFAHILIPDGEYGAISGMNGEFTLEVKGSKIPDSLKISSLGFIEKIVPIDTDKVENLVVSLTPKVYTMEGISVYAENESKSVILGTIFSPNVLYGWPSFSATTGKGETLSSFAVPINWPFDKPFTPERARIRLAVTSGDSVMIRVRMLSRHPETGMPFEDLLYDQIIASDIDDNGWVDFRFDAGKYWFYEKELFLVFEWVFSGNQVSYIAPMFTQKEDDDSWFLYRHRSDNEWTKTEKELIYSLFARY